MAVSSLKSLLAVSGYYSGLLGLFRRARLCGKALILMYHRVIAPDANPTVPVQPGMYVSSVTFHSHLLFLQERFNVIPLRELVERLRNGNDVRHCCVLTFDDGWRDNYQHVFPLLRKFQAPATVFLATGLVGTNRWFWPEEVVYFLTMWVNGRIEAGKLSELTQSLLSKVPAGVNALEKGIDTTVETLKNMLPEDRQKILAQMWQACQIGKERSRLLMNWDEVREMAKSGLIDFGSHTVNHILLDQVSPQQMQEEVEASRNQIEAETDRPCFMFVFPNGNYNCEALRVLGSTGMDAAVTTRRGYVAPDSSLLELPRISIHEDVSRSFPLFYWRMLVQ